MPQNPLKETHLPYPIAAYPSWDHVRKRFAAYNGRQMLLVKRKRVRKHCHKQHKMHWQLHLKSNTLHYSPSLSHFNRIQSPRIITVTTFGKKEIYARFDSPFKLDLHHWF